MKIREQIGNFKGTDLMKQPSKYAARLAQAFTATEASVSIKRDEWEEIEDIKPPKFEDGKPNPYLFTDGVGSISKSLGDKIWAELCSNRRDHGENSIQPSAVRLFHLNTIKTEYATQISRSTRFDSLGTKVWWRLMSNSIRQEQVNTCACEIRCANSSLSTMM